LAKRKKTTTVCTFCGETLERKGKVLKEYVTRKFGKVFQRICADCDRKQREVYSKS